LEVFNVKYIPLWLLLPAIKNREAALRYMANAERILGRPLNECERAYLEDVVRQGEYVERLLRELGYFDGGPRGELLRNYGISVESDEEAEEVLRRLEAEGTE
jgi:hypothetical protein